MGRNPKESTRSFVRGKNYEALVVSPPKGFETPSDKISKKTIDKHHILCYNKYRNKEKEKIK